MNASCLALAAVILLAGCDRYAPTPPVDDLPPPAAVAVGQMYVKEGSELLRIDQPVEFRAQAFPGVSLYAWSTSGTVRIAINFNGDSRIALISGAVSGPTLIRVQAQDDRGRTLYTGSFATVVL